MAEIALGEGREASKTRSLGVDVLRAIAVVARVACRWKPAVVATCLILTGCGYWDTVDLTRQRRTVETLMEHARSLESLRVAEGRYPPAAWGPLSRLATELPGERPGRARLTDAWGRDLLYMSDGESYLLWSLGSNGTPDIFEKGGTQYEFEVDIVVHDGRIWQSGPVVSAVGGSNPFDDPRFDLGGRIVTPGLGAVSCGFVEGLARTVIDGRMAFFDQRLDVVLRTGFEFASPFDSGRAVVCDDLQRVADGEHVMLRGGRCGVIDRTGAVVVAPRRPIEALRPLDAGEGGERS